MSENQAWLEERNGRRWAVAMTCSIGRSSSNDVVLDDGHASRRHALVHKQDDAEFWVIDLGSGNGTYVNGRRVALPMRITNGDLLTVGESQLTFKQGGAPTTVPGNTGQTEQTIIRVKTFSCWLLVADIKGSTVLAQQLATTELAQLFGRWMSTCKEVVEQNGGAINKYLGDGFLAYWYADGSGGNSNIATGLGALLDMQRAGGGPAFRFALHQGNVTVGGGGSAGEDSLSGQDVIRVFRMEKLVSSLGRDALLSSEAASMLNGLIPLRDEGSHVLQGFDNAARRFYSPT